MMIKYGIFKHSKSWANCVWLLSKLMVFFFETFIYSLRRFNILVPIKKIFSTNDDRLWWRYRYTEFSSKKLNLELSVNDGIIFRSLLSSLSEGVSFWSYIPYTICTIYSLHTYIWSWIKFHPKSSRQIN